MRRQHRFIATVLGLLMAYWAASGLVLVLYDVTDSAQVWAIEGGGPGAGLIERTGPLPAPEALSHGIEVALEASRSMKIASADLRLVGTAPRLQVAEAGGDRATMRRFYANSGDPMPDAIADQATPIANAGLRNTIKSFHKGSAFGLGGQVLGLVAGLAVLAMTVTGLYTYFPLLKARRRMDKNAVFWSTRSDRLRQFHRWISIVAAIFLLNMAVTGAVLAVTEFRLNLFLQYHVGSPPYPRPSPMPAISDGQIRGNILTMLQTSFVAAGHNGQQVSAITLICRQGSMKALVTTGGPKPRIIALDPVSGRSVSDWATTGVQHGNGYFTDWHQIVKRMHRGDIIGSFAGRYIDIAAGLALLYLTLSGLVMYGRILRQRLIARKPGWFWK